VALAAITERSNLFTAREESKTGATSGSNTTATVRGPSRDANRFGRERE
jgi:hypothetical protein